jgi:hypothetical protein
VEFLILLLAGFHCEINPMAGCRIFGHPTGWIVLENKCQGWTWLAGLYWKINAKAGHGIVMLLAGFHWKIHPMAGGGISRNAIGWISLGPRFQDKSHEWTWNFWYCC